MLKYVNYVHICTNISMCIQLCCKCVQIFPNVYNCVHISTNIAKFWSVLLCLHMPAMHCVKK